MIVFLVIVAAGVLSASLAYKACIAPYAVDIEREEQVKRARAERVGRERSEDGGFLARAAAAVERILPITRESERAYREKLDRAGIRTSAAMWRGITVVVAFAGLVIGGFFASTLGIGFIGIVISSTLTAIVGWLACRIYLLSKTKARREDIERRLPDALERLSTIVVSGMQIDEAFREVANGGEMGAVGEEFARVDREINLINISREEALDSMSRRCQSIDMTFFVSALIQATREGASISNTLQQQSANARSAWFDRMKERINKIDTKLSMTLGLCFLPATVVLIVAPILAQTVTQISSIL